MLFVALVLSVVLLLAVNLIAWRAEHPVGKILTACLFAGLASIGFLGMILPPVLLQTVLVGAITLLWGRTNWRPHAFFSLSCAATLIAFSIPTYLAFRDTRKLQQEFAFVSVEARAPAPRSPRQVETSSSMSTRLSLVESRITKAESEGIAPYRTRLLRQVHDDAVTLFVQQPSFGVGRMSTYWLAQLRANKQKRPPIPQPGATSPSPWPSESLKLLPANTKAQDSLLSFHEESLVDFVNPAGFGYARDRQHVAGFQEHLISQPPSPPKSLTLQHLDLIGLARHDEPTAYVSDNLPRMDELRTAPTRPLDEFENAGLLALKRGDDLFFRERGTEWRMLGAIRAARQCVLCHGCERGDLLGAFSYRLTTASAPAEKPGER